jgi:hypothetical protein
MKMDPATDAHHWQVPVEDQVLNRLFAASQIYEVGVYGCGLQSISATGERSLVRFLVRFWKTHRRGKRTGNGKCLKDWE